MIQPEGLKALSNCMGGEKFSGVLVTSDLKLYPAFSLRKEHEPTISKPRVKQDILVHFQGYFTHLTFKTCLGPENEAVLYVDT